MNFSTVLPRLLPFPALRLLDAPLGRLLGLPALERRYGLLRNTGRPIAQELLAQLEVACRISERDLEQIPRAGPVVVVANHPYGILEGAALAALLEPIRPDARFLANGILSLIPEVRDLVIPVDPVGKGAQNNSGGLRQALEFLEQGGLLVVFPVGEVSHLSWRERAVTDPEWHSTAARMVEIASRRGHAPAVVPAYIRGANGLLFQAAGLAHPRLRTALLGRELLNKRGRKIEIRIGSPISAEK
ncbi:MAG: hypothetical protein FJW37_13355, partial [Acidobacteria bacterium]|nr:hypothetical protein [Acidobacteriota bacterium]